MDIAIGAAIKTKSNLLVIGDGPEHAKLVELAGNSKYIKFMPRYNGISEIVEHIVDSRAYIFPSIEPFGIAAVESLAVGTPVIGLQKGGSLDIIEPGVNGLFFEEQTVDSLAKAIVEFDKLSLSTSKVSTSSNKFSEIEFVNKMKKIINNYEK